MNEAESLLGLISSILAHYGVQPVHKTLPVADKALAAPYRNVVLLVMDGMGSAILKKHPESSAFLTANKAADIASVFPPTTAAATTTLQSGLSPAEHGWLGWTLYFDEIHANVDVLPNQLTATHQRVKQPMGGTCMPYTPVWETLHQADPALSACAVSPFSRTHPVSTLSKLFDTVSSLCRAEGRYYVYAYWPQPDSHMHDGGTRCPEAGEDLRAISAGLMRLQASLAGTLLLVTADHGQMDTVWRRLPDYPALSACLRLPPSIESRAVSFFVKDGCKEAFEQAFARALGDCFTLYSHAEALALFGSGTPHPRTVGFVGDYLVVATGNVSLDAMESGSPAPMIGMHAGGTREESTVPLILLPCKK